MSSNGPEWRFIFFESAKKKCFPFFMYVAMTCPTLIIPSFLIPTCLILRKRAVKFEEILLREETPKRATSRQTPFLCFIKSCARYEKNSL